MLGNPANNRTRLENICGGVDIFTIFRTEHFARISKIIAPRFDVDVARDLARALLSVTLHLKIASVH